MNNTEANTVLSDEQIASITKRNPCTTNHVLIGPRILLTINERDALCATVKALRAQLEESEAHNRVIRERLILADGVYDARGEYTIHAQTAIHRATSDLQSRLAEVERERNSWRSRAERWQKEKDEIMEDFTKALRKLK